MYRAATTTAERRQGKKRATPYRAHLEKKHFFSYLSKEREKERKKIAEEKEGWDVCACGLVCSFVN